MRPSRRPAVGALAVVGLALIAAVPALFVRDLWNGDEIRLTEAGREMVVLRDWRVPRLNGEPMPDRPPLPYWATALLWKAGAGMRSARELSALSVVGLLLLCYLAVSTRAGMRVGLLAAAATLTTGTVFWHARTGGPTPLLAFFATAAILAGHRAMHDEGSRVFAWWLGSYAAMALGVLSGGLMGVLLPAAALLAYGAASGTAWRPRLSAHLAGLVLFCAIAAAWLAGCGPAIGGTSGAVAALTGDVEGLWRTVSEGDLVRSALGGVLALLPWIVIVPTALARGLRRRDRFGLLAAVWLAVLAVPLLLAGDSHYAYAMPAAVPLGMLCAGALTAGSGETALRGAMKRLTGAALAVAASFTGAVLLVGLADLAGLSYLLIGTAYVCPVTMQPYSPITLAAALPFAGLALALLLRGLFMKPPTGLRRAAALVSAVMLLGIGADLFLTPVVDAYVSAAPFAEQVAAEHAGEGGLYLFRKDYDGLYNLYTGRVQIPVIDSPERLEAALADEGSYVICDEKRLKRVRLLKALKGREVAGGNVGGRYMMLLRGGA